VEIRTLLLGRLGTHAVNPHLMPSLPYDPMREFTPNIAHSKTKILLVVRPQPGVRTLDSTGAQLIAPKIMIRRRARRGFQCRSQATPAPCWAITVKPRGGTYWAMPCVSLSRNRKSGQGGCARVGARGMASDASFAAAWG
jgi:hypothetical protein